MLKHLYKSLLVPVTFRRTICSVVLVVVSLTLTGHGPAEVAAQAGQTKTLDRNLEPVIVKGSQVPALDGAPVAELFVYTFSGNTLSGPIPAQVDEVTSGGDYTASEDGLLDGNDEIVFMAKDTGDQPADTSALNSFTTWHEIEVSDPVNSGHKGWAYLVRSNTSPAPAGDYVNYVSGDRRITTTPHQYRLGFAATHFAMDYLTLPINSSLDILDRAKLRIAGSGFTVNEISLGNPEPVLIKDGQVRVIVRRNADMPSLLASLSATYLAYSSMVHSMAEVDSSVGVSTVRTSVDLNNSGAGATFYNANTLPGGVTIDGSPDGVDATPFSNWTQISHTSGRLVQVTDPTPAGGTPKNYYCDDTGPGTFECDNTNRTGDNLSYGDSGVAIEGSMNRSFTILSALYVLPPGQENVGASYAQYFSHPLHVSAYLEGERFAIFLPFILRNSQ